METVAHALSLDESSKEILYTRAFRLLNAGRSGRAANIFYLLCAADGTQPDYWLGFGLCLRALNHVAQAMAVFGVANRLAPDQAAPVFYRVEIFMRAGCWDEARTELEAFDRVACQREDAALISAASGFRTALARRGS